MADSTYTTRRCQWRNFMQFCAMFDLVPLPASTDTICLYLTYMAETFVFSSIVNYLSAVWVLHRVNNIPHVDIHSQNITFTLKGIRRMLGDASASAIPFTVKRRIYTNLDMSKSEDLAFWASLLLGFRGLLIRKSNLFDHGLALTLSDISFKEWGVLLSIRRTKTICFKERVLSITLSTIPGSIFCVKFYLTCLMAMVQYPSHQSHCLSYMRGSNFYQCTYQWFSRKLSLVCGALGLSRYTSHSLRRGGATALAEANVPLHDIKVIGDWKSLSVLLYLERSLESKIDLDIRNAAILFKN